MTPNEYRRQVAEIAQKMHQRQMVNTNEGNVSACDGERVYITPSQVCKETLTPDMIAVCDLNGNQLEGELPISSETGMHLHIYKLRSDVRAVTHCHAPFATAFAINRKPIKSDSYTELIFLHDEIPVVDYGTPGTPAISAGIKDYIDQTDMMLLANHGLVTVGATLDDAYRRAESAESLAKTLFIAQLLGGGHPLAQAELDELYAMRKEKLGKGRIIHK